MLTNKTKSLNIRGLSEDVIEQLQKIATKNERSLEAEMRYLIQQWCLIQNPNQISQTDVLLKDTAGRLHKALENVNKINANEITFSQLAEKLNVSIHDIDTWFSGKAEMPFYSLDILSHFFGCNPQWLKHGDEVGTAYSKNVYCISNQSPLLFAKDFLSTKLDGEPVYKLHIILNEDTGYVYIVQEFKNSYISYTYISSSFYLKGEYSSNGLDNTARFVLVLLALNKIKTSVIINGYTIKDKFAVSIFNTSEEHPLMFKKYAEKSSWNEDIIDSSYPVNYWDGYKTLQQHIHTHINNNTLLTQYRNEILSI